MAVSMLSGFKEDLVTTYRNGRSWPELERRSERRGICICREPFWLGSRSERVTKVLPRGLRTSCKVFLKVRLRRKVFCRLHTRHQLALNKEIYIYIYVSMRRSTWLPRHRLSQWARTVHSASTECSHLHELGILRSRTCYFWGRGKATSSLAF